MNFYGISDLAALVDEPFVRRQLPHENQAAAARSFSPTTYIRAGVCPVLSIHGTADSTVPPSQSRRLTELLQQTNGPGGAHLTLIEGGSMALPSENWGLRIRPFSIFSTAMG